MRDRLQSAWAYTNAEIWRPLFRQFEAEHPDLPIAVARAMLERRPAARPIFVPPGTLPALDALRADVANALDLPADARAALRRVKPNWFLEGRAVATLFGDIATEFRDYDNPDLDARYRVRLAAFVDRHALPYRFTAEPLRLVPLLPADMDALYYGLFERADAENGIREALSSFEAAWDRQATDWSQMHGKEAIRAASLLAENILVSASNGQENEFTRALTRMRNGNRFPSNDFANIFDRAYTFANTYPNIRHPGNPECQRRELRPEDARLAALVFIGLSACAHDLCQDAA